MWMLTKTFRFEASHELPHHDGKCARLHGHSWRGTVYVMGNALQESGPKQGMVIDYGDISKPVNALVERFLDHYHLNESLKLESPTSERLAQWIFLALKNQIPGLTAVSIEETCTSSCTYTPDDSNLPILPVPDLNPTKE